MKYAAGFALLVCGYIAASDPPLRLIWYPTYSEEGGRVTEGIYIRMSPPTGMRVRVQGECEGKLLDVAEGRPNEVSGFMATPVRESRCYKIVRLDVWVGRDHWELQSPVAGKYYALEKKENQ